MDAGLRRHDVARPGAENYWVLVGQVTLDVNATQPAGGSSAVEAAMIAAAKTALKGM